LAPLGSDLCSRSFLSARRHQRRNPFAQLNVPPLAAMRSGAISWCEIYGCDTLRPCTSGYWPLESLGCSLF
jgi:hypothetical protein